MTKVFVAKIEKFSTFDGLPDLEQGELSFVTNTDRIKAKRAAYGLLHYGLNACGYDGDRLMKTLQKTEYGKPMACGVEISLSHSKTVVAVAISTRPVGVDVETLDGRNVADFSFALSQGERTETAEDFLSLWTKKESIFKRNGNEKRFQPKAFRADVFPTVTQTFSLDGVEYVLSVATDERAEIIYMDI